MQDKSTDAGAVQNPVSENEGRGYGAFALVSSFVGGVVTCAAGIWIVRQFTA